MSVVDFKERALEREAEGYVNDLLELETEIIHFIGQKTVAFLEKYDEQVVGMTLHFTNGPDEGEFGLCVRVLTEGLYEAMCESGDPEDDPDMCHVLRGLFQEVKKSHD